MRLRIKAMEPLRYENNSNFKLAPYYAWVEAGGQIAKPHYGWRKFRPLLRIQELLIPKSTKTAMLCFAEPPSLDVDTFPWWGHYEIIPVLWDCWPRYWETTERWFRRHKVKAAVFTSSQTADEFRKRLPEMNILTITEGIETELYHGDKTLNKRDIDFLQFGRVANMFTDIEFGDGIRVLSSKNEKTFLKTRKDLIAALSDSKIVLAVPRCDMQPDIAQGIETLTQRYWECMLSGVIILGRAPQELIDYIGYDPVIHINQEKVTEQVQDIVNHVGDYQSLVDKNKQVAQQKGNWSLRIEQIRNWLQQLGYSL